MCETFDVIVLGLGAHGSSALYHLSKTHKKVAGIDRYTPPHPYGSSHGQTRIIRQAYHENPVYVPLVKGAYALWKEMEQETGQQLLLQTGGLLLGRPDAHVITGARLSADTHHIAYEYLQAADLQRRFPAFRPTPDTVGVLEKEAGILFPETCITTFLAGAARNNASIRCDEAVLGITPQKNSVEIITSKGRYAAGKMIISTGAWTGALLPELHLPLSVARQVLYWFKDGHNRQPSHFLPANMPVYIWEYLPGRMFYGFPDLGNGIKIARHHEGRPIGPDDLDQDVSAAEISDIRDIAGTYLDIDPVFDSTAVCMYTNTPDEDFIIDFHPMYDNIIIASPCSGHGFKFSSLTGKILSDLATDSPTGFDLSPFSITRPSLR